MGEEAAKLRFEKFLEYIKGNVSKSPYMFAVSIDGWGYNYYYCGSGGGCEGGDQNILEECLLLQYGIMQNRSY